MHLPRRSLALTRVAPTARLWQQPLPQLAPDSDRWPGRTLSLAGTEVFVRSAPPLGPDAEPALAVHGLGGASTNWTDLAALVRGRLAVDALDLPGFGRSGPPADGDYSPSAQARVVIEYLRTSGRGPVHLIGNSLGGLVSLIAAARRPDLLRSLTVISPAVPDLRLRAHPLRADPWLGVVVVPGLGTAALRKAATFPAEEVARGTIKLCFAEPSRYPASRLAQDVAEGEAQRELPWANEALVRATRSLARAQFLQARHTWSVIREVRTPTLVLWGDTDRLVNAELAPYVAAAIPDARLLTLPNVGHTAMMEDPTSTARAILALVEDVADSAEPSAATA